LRTAQDIIKALDLQPHPEGGFYKEIYRSQSEVYSDTAKAQRNTLTCIYFLLEKGQRSRFHQVKHDEVWNFYLGDPLRLIDVNQQDAKDIILGNYSNDIISQHVIKANHWQAAEPLGEYAFVGCSVAPGFNFNDFSFLPEHEKEKMRIEHPHLVAFF
jgi:predicted cupin superfamily sugar epimerase